MSYRKEVEDGLGWGGLVPTKAERAEYQRQQKFNAQIADLTRQIAESKAENERLTALLSENQHMHSVESASMSAMLERAEKERDALLRGEYICQQCGLRKNDDHPKGDF